MSGLMNHAPISHDYLGAHHDRNAARTRWVVALSAAMMVGEIIAGYTTGSMALLADGFHMATHTGALGVAALAYHYARRHACDPRFSFGTGKVGDLAGFASALILGVFALGIAGESVNRLFEPMHVDFGDATLVAVIGLGVNLASAALLFDGHHHHGPDGHDHRHDNNLRAAYLHVLADALTSVLAIGALLAGRYLGLVWLDPAIGVVGALVIARWSWTLMQQTGAILLDRTDDRVAAQVRALVEPEAHIVDLHVWRLGPGALAVIVDVAEPETIETIRERLKHVKGVVHLTVQAHPSLPPGEGLSYRAAMPAIAPSRLWRDEAVATASLAGPLILTNVAQSAINATDVLMLGWLGARELAASALGANLFIAFLIFGMGLVMAASPMLARQLGQHKHSVREIRRTVRQAMWAAVTVTVPVWIALWHSEALLRMLGQDPQLSAAAAEFARPLMFGFLPALLYLVLRAFVAALERPAWALYISIGGVTLNAVLNYGLIFGAFGLPRWGLFGAGVGSAITQTLMFIGMALVLLRHRRFRRYRLFGRFWRADWPRYVEVWRLGLPIGLTLALEVTVFNAAVFLMGLIGTASLAAHAIAIQIASLTFMVPLGLSQAVTVRVGLAFGRGDPAGIGRAGWTAFIMSVGFMTAMAAIMLAIPDQLVALFLDKSLPINREVIPLAISFIGIAALFQIFDGAQAVGAGMLRGLQDTTLPLIFAAFGYWVIGMGTAVGLGFGLGWDGVGIWIGLAAGLAIVSVMMLWRWLLRERLGLTAPPKLAIA